MVSISLILPKTTRGELDHPFPPLGILYLGSSLLRYNIEVNVIDGNAVSDEDYENQISNIDSDFIGLSATFFHMKEINQLLPTLKSFKKPLILGGPGVSSILDKRAYLHDSGIDFMLEGEAEETLPKLIRYLSNGDYPNDIAGLYALRDGELVVDSRIPRVDVNANPIPARNLVELSKYTEKWGNYTGMIASRGCPYQCTFCDLTVAGHKVRYRNIENVIAEMKELQDMGLGDVFIFDDLFTVNRKYLEAFREAKSNAGLNITWGGNARVNLVNDDFCATVRESDGTRLFMGVESGSERMLQMYNKGITPEQTRKSFELCWEYGVEPKGYVLVGHPEETWEDVQKTADLVSTIRPGYLDVSILTPIPNTKLFEQTRDLIDFARLNDLDTRQRDTVYKELKFDIRQAVALINDAYKSSR